MATLIHGVMVKRWMKQGGITPTHTFLGVDGYVYKQCPKHNAQNEFYALHTLRNTGYVPYAEWIMPEVLKMEYIVKEPIDKPDLFLAHCQMFLDYLKEFSLRHGDLTRYSVIPRNNMPIVVDWAESRLWEDPRPDKRKGGDKYWMMQTAKELMDEDVTLQRLGGQPSGFGFLSAPLSSYLLLAFISYCTGIV